MKYLILTLLILFSKISLSQESEKRTTYEIYQVKSYTVVELNSKYISTWPKAIKTNLVVIIQIDSTYNEESYNEDYPVVRTLKVYSGDYHEYSLNEIVKYASDVKGNVLLEFKSTDEGEEECSIDIIYYKGKSHIVIKYKDVTI